MSICGIDEAGRGPLAGPVHDRLTFAFTFAFTELPQAGTVLMAITDGRGISESRFTIAKDESVRTPIGRSCGNTSSRLSIHVTSNGNGASTDRCRPRDELRRVDIKLRISETHVGSGIHDGCERYRTTRRIGREELRNVWRNDRAV
mgnify:CR=1 FL=1